MPNGKLKYSEPVITRVKLDPEQAVLAVCVLGARKKFNGGGVDWDCITVGSPLMSCTQRGTGLGRLMGSLSAGS